MRHIAFTQLKLCFPMLPRTGKLMDLEGRRSSMIFEYGSDLYKYKAEEHDTVSVSVAWKAVFARTFATE